MKPSKANKRKGNGLIIALLLAAGVICLSLYLQRQAIEKSWATLEDRARRLLRAEATSESLAAQVEELSDERNALLTLTQDLTREIAEATTSAAATKEQLDTERRQLDQIKEDYSKQINVLLKKIEETEEKLEQLKVSKTTQRRLKAAGTALGEFTYRGQTFQQVVIKKATPAELIIAHADGASSFDFTYLSPELRERYGYYRPTAETYLHKRAEAEHLHIAQRQAYKEAQRKEDLARAQQIAQYAYENQLSDKRYEILKAEARVRSLKNGLATTSKRAASYSRFEQALVKADKELLRLQLELNAMKAELTP